MATLTIADLDNGKRDLQTVDEVANSRAATATTRFGQQTTTLYEAIRRINATGDEILSNLGFRVPVPYASGLNVTDSRFTVTGPDGKVYAPLSAPFTTGAWDPSQWYVLQNDLNDHKLLVFESRAAASSAATTLPDGQEIKINADEAHGGATTLNSVSAGAAVFVGLYGNSKSTSYKFGAPSAIAITAHDALSLTAHIGYFGDPSTTDWTVAIQKAVDELPAGATLNFNPSVVYNITAQIVVSKPLALNFNDSTVKEASFLGIPMIVCSNFSGGRVNNLRIEGAETAGTFTGSLDHLGLRIENSDDVEVTDVSAVKKSNAVIFNNCNRSVATLVYLNGVVTSDVAGDNNSGAVRFIAGTMNRAVLCGAENAGGAVYQTFEGRGLSVIGAWAQACWDNGVYISSGYDCVVTGGTFKNLKGSGSVGVKARGDGHTITATTTEDSFGGIQVSGNGTTPDSENANGKGTVVSANTMRNLSQSGIVINFQDGLDPRDFTISSNQMYNVATGGGDNAAINVRGNGHSILDNTIVGYGGTYAIIAAGADSSTMRRRIKITDNKIRGGGPRDGIRLAFVADSDVIDNMFDGDAGADFIEMRSCDGVRVIGNTAPTAAINAPASFPSTNLEIWGNKVASYNVSGDQQFGPQPARFAAAMGNASLVVTTVQAQAVAIEISGTFTGQRTLTMPTIRRQWSVYAGITGGFGVLIKTAAGTGVVVADGKRAIVSCDGTNIVRVSPDV